MLKYNIIEPSFSPYSSPVTLVTKKDKSKRFCVDYRRLNEIISSDAHPLSLIDNILDKRFFLRILSLEISPLDRNILSFVTLDAQYTFLRLPYGISVGPQLFERAIQQILQRNKIDSIAHYFNDFIIFSNSIDEHLHHLQQFFDMCSYTISSGTYTPLVKNIEVINAIKVPTNIKTLQSFLGAINVYNKFIKDHARIRVPLNNPLKKDTPWHWDAKCKQSFNTLKDNTWILKQQRPDGTLHPVQYYSRALRPHDKNYTITELECLAIIDNVEKFRIYLTGVKFTIFTDHHALQWLKTIKNPSGRLFRWSLKLSAYDYDVRYLKGKMQFEADLLSRNPLCERPPIALEPYDTLSIDTISGFSKYGNVKSYLHVIVDHLSRYTWTFPSKSTSTVTYIQCIKKVMQCGRPKRLLSDRAPAFTSPKFRRFLVQNGVQPLLATSNNPQANGLCDRLNSTLTGKLRLLHLENPKTSWTKLIKLVTKKYNDTPHTLNNHIDPYPNIIESRKLAIQRTNERYVKEKIRYDSEHKELHFEIGDVVLIKVYKQPNSGKLMQSFSGPYTIVDRISDNVVRIDRPNQYLGSSTDTVHEARKSEDGGTSPTIPTKRPSNLSPQQETIFTEETPPQRTSAYPLTDRQRREQADRANDSPDIPARHGNRAAMWPKPCDKFHTFDLTSSRQCSRQQATINFTEATSIYKLYMERLQRQQEYKPRPSFLTELLSHNTTRCLPRLPPADIRRCSKSARAACARRSAGQPPSRPVSPAGILLSHAPPGDWDLGPIQRSCYNAGSVLGFEGIRSADVELSWVGWCTVEARKVVRICDYGEEGVRRRSG
ncbi:hypothetical protein LAZ67_2003492 [Cordylochernes scorpioides]|uniref:Integrase catalytic domain-containing protein n=1 Tax=Cordylochernes scorpioides TaxID=51811 RepID=A0ABY6K4I8_9ARAC|nr:hypothetical protein LAZ67_2003492 [Cordylochernes scorpioides]